MSDSHGYFLSRIRIFVSPRTGTTLYDDVNNGIVPLDSKGPGKMTLKDIYLMRPEYVLCDFKKFSSRLNSIRKSIKGLAS